MEKIMVTIVKSGYATGYWWAWIKLEQDYATCDEVEAQMYDNSTSVPTQDFIDGVEAALSEHFNPGDKNEEKPPRPKVQQAIHAISTGSCKGIKSEPAT